MTGTTRQHEPAMTPGQVAVSSEQTPVRPSETDRAMVPEECDHAWASRHKPGHLLYWVRQCMICHDADWDDLDAQIGKLVAAERQRIRELADRTGAACTGDEGTGHWFSALLDDEASAPLDGGPGRAEIEGQMELAEGDHG